MKKASQHVLFHRAPSKQEIESMRRKPRKHCAEAIAMRRIIASEGWISPFMKNVPLPVLTQWEWSVDLLTLEPWKNYDPVTGRMMESRH